MMMVKQGRIAMLYTLADRVLSKYRYPGKEGYNLFLFRREAQKISQFLSEESRKLVDKYKPEILGDGRLKFKTSEECTEYCNERDEIEDMEVEISTLPIRLRIPEDCELSPADFDLMDGMIEFYWPEEPEEVPEVKLELVKEGKDNGGENA